MTTPWTVTWVTAFLDLPPAVRDAGTGFWQSVTGYASSPARGDEDEFVSLVPPHGDPFLKVQRTGAGAAPATGPAVHVDLAVASPAEAAERAVSLGASVVARPEDGHVVVRSPGGFVVCFVTGRHEVRPAPTRWPHGHESLVDQVCLDLPPRLHDAEVRFWSSLTDWPVRRSADRAEFGHLVRPAGIPLRFLLQRLDDDAPAVTAHLDLACDAREAEVARHVDLGAVVLGDPGGGWTALRDPAGLPYCITDRDPGSGLS
jgi:hypothetical protein